MKRWLIAMATFALVAAACTASGGGDTPSAVDTASGASHAPVTLEMWGAWTGRELKQFNTIFDGFTEKYPWITVNSTGGVNDQKILAAISAGDPPDTVLSFTLDSVGQFCATGAWQDLNPYIEQSGFDVSQFPPSVEVYTSYAGSRCAFPFLKMSLLGTGGSTYRFHQILVDHQHLGDGHPNLARWIRRVDAHPRA